jgi:hypothetical protein
MAKRHGAREQKRQAKQKAKRDEKRRQLARQTSPNPVIRLQAADRWPITACLVPDSVWTEGIGSAVIARRAPDGQLACAVFLLDVYCLGVKDAFWRVVSPAEFNDLLERIEKTGPLHKVTPEYLAKLVYQTADYGQSLGFPPHSDFRHAQRLLAGIDPSKCPDEFKFGHEGKPLYIRGPNESLEEARIIARRVEQHGGDFTLPLKPEELLAEWPDEVETDEIETDEFAADEIKRIEER